MSNSSTSASSMPSSFSAPGIAMEAPSPGLQCWPLSATLPRATWIQARRPPRKSCGTLVTVLDRYIPQDASVSAVYPHSRHLSPKVRAFVDFLAERFGPRPYWDLVE